MLDSLINNNVDSLAILAKDSVPFAEDSLNFAALTTTQAHKVDIRFQGTENPFALQSQNWIGLVFLFQALVYAYFFIRYRKQWIENIRMLFKSNDYSDTLMESSVNFSRSSVYLSCFFVINLAIFLYLFFSRNFIYYDNKSVIILLFIGAVFLFCLLKIFLLRFLGYIFLGRSAEMKSFQNSIFVMMEFLGIVLGICVLLLIYSPFFNHVFIFAVGFLSCIGFIFLVVYRLIKYFFVGFYSFLYLILYLCTLEILPAVLLYATLVKIQQIVL
jgi:hypothetical protein